MTIRSTTESDGDESEIKRSILAYLRSHPDAADTLRGIVNWWLPRQRYETSRQRIAEVVDAMVAEGLLRREELPGGGVLYALNSNETR